MTDAETKVTKVITFKGVPSSFSSGRSFLSSQGMAVGPIVHGFLSNAKQTETQDHQFENAIASPSNVSGFSGLQPAVANQDAASAYMTADFIRKEAPDQKPPFGVLDLTNES